MTYWLTASSALVCRSSQPHPRAWWRVSAESRAVREPRLFRELLRQPCLFLYKSLSLLGIIMLIQIRNEHVGALARIRNGDRAANSAVAAGDNRLLSGETTRAVVSGTGSMASVLPGIDCFCFGNGD